MRRGMGQAVAHEQWVDVAKVSDADAAVPPRRLKSDGERRPDLHAAAILPLSRDGGKGDVCLQILNSAPPRLCAR